MVQKYSAAVLTMHLTSNCIILKNVDKGASMTKSAHDEMLKWMYAAEHCQTKNFAVQTLLSATTKLNGPLSAHLLIFTRILRRLSLLTILCWNYMRSWSYLFFCFCFFHLFLQELIKI